MEYKQNEIEVPQKIKEPWWSLALRSVLGIAGTTLLMLITVALYGFGCYLTWTDVLVPFTAKFGVVLPELEFTYWMLLYFGYRLVENVFRRVKEEPDVPQEMFYHRIKSIVVFIICIYLIGLFI